VALIDVEIFVAYGQAEQCGEQYSPRTPFGSAELLTEEVGVLDGFENVHWRLSESSELARR
jgi:hypothetical protein